MDLDRLWAGKIKSFSSVVDVAISMNKNLQHLLFPLEG